MKYVVKIALRPVVSLFKAVNNGWTFVRFLKAPVGLKTRHFGG